MWTCVIVNLRYKTSTKSQQVHNKARTHILQIQIHSRCDCEAHTQPFHPILPEAPDCCTEHTILLVQIQCVVRTNMETHAWCSEHTNMSTHVSWMHTNSIYRRTNILIHSCIYTITTLLVMINIMAFFHIEQTSLMLENFSGYFNLRYVVFTKMLQHSKNFRKQQSLPFCNERAFPCKLSSSGNSLHFQVLLGIVYPPCVCLRIACSILAGGSRLVLFNRASREHM